MNDFDVLDYLSPEERKNPLWRWRIRYKDGSHREAQFRHDLIRQSEMTRITKRGLQEWPEWAGGVV